MCLFNLIFSSEKMGEEAEKGNQQRNILLDTISEYKVSVNVFMLKSFLQSLKQGREREISFLQPPQSDRIC